jgi:hypothetical protein
MGTGQRQVMMGSFSLRGSFRRVTLWTVGRASHPPAAPARLWEQLPMSRWYYTLDNKQRLGPVTSEELRALAVALTIRPECMVMPEGGGKWVPAAKIKGLFKPAPPAPLPSGTVNVPCPSCGRVIPLRQHELSLVIQCAKCGTQFVPSQPSGQGAASSATLDDHALSGVVKEAQVPGAGTATPVAASVIPVRLPWYRRRRYWLAVGAACAVGVLVVASLVIVAVVDRRIVTPEVTPASADEGELRRFVEEANKGRYLPGLVVPEREFVASCQLYTDPIMMDHRDLISVAISGKGWLAIGCAVKGSRAGREVQRLIGDGRQRRIVVRLAVLDRHIVRDLAIVQIVGARECD